MQTLVQMLLLARNPLMVLAVMVVVAAVVAASVLLVHCLGFS